MFSGVCPVNLISLGFHILDEFLFSLSALYGLIDGSHGFNFPGLPFDRHLILVPAEIPAWGFFSDNVQAFSLADLVTEFFDRFQVIFTKLDFFAVLKADTVHDQVIVDMVFICMCSHNHLIAFETLLSHLQAYLVLSLIHISEPTRLGMISYAVFCLKKKKRSIQRQ